MKTNTTSTFTNLLLYIFFYKHSKLHLLLKTLPGTASTFIKISSPVQESPTTEAGPEGSFSIPHSEGTAVQLALGIGLEAVVVVAVEVVMVVLAVDAAG